MAGKKVILVSRGEKMAAALIGRGLNVLPLKVILGKERGNNLLSA